MYMAHCSSYHVAFEAIPISFDPYVHQRRLARGHGGDTPMVPAYRLVPGYVKSAVRDFALARVTEPIGLKLAQPVDVVSHLLFATHGK